MTAITLSDGATVRATIAGQGPPIIFIHGWAMNGGLFAEQQEAFKDSFRTIAIDLRGHGGSRGGGQPATIERLAADLVEIFELLELDRAVCVGWSMGAMVAWEALADPAFAARVRGLVVIDMSPRISNDSAWRLGLADGRRPESTIRSVEAMRRDWPAMVRRFVPRILAPGAEVRRSDLIARIIEEADALDNETMAGLWESMAVQDFRKTLKTLTTPTLVVHGAKSQLYAAATGEFIARQTPDAILVEFPQSGHAPHLEEPEAFNVELRNFIEELDSRAVSAASPLAATP